MLEALSRIGGFLLTIGTMAVLGLLLHWLARKCLAWAQNPQRAARIVAKLPNFSGLSESERAERLAATIRLHQHSLERVRMFYLTAAVLAGFVISIALVKSGVLIGDAILRSVGATWRLPEGLVFLVVVLWPVVSVAALLALARANFIMTAKASQLLDDIDAARPFMCSKCKYQLEAQPNLLPAMLQESSKAPDAIDPRVHIAQCPECGATNVRWPQRAGEPALTPHSQPVPHS
jgi:endogenous inhibitor of DNA gyrase (YacG/DUF329 family)